MNTELDRLRLALRQYNSAASQQEFNKAEKILNSFHKKYGTVDPIVIKSLIN